MSHCHAEGFGQIVSTFKIEGLVDPANTADTASHKLDQALRMRLQHCLPHRSEVGHRFKNWPLSQEKDCNFRVESFAALRSLCS